jgi:hypothetical protein
MKTSSSLAVITLIGFSLTACTNPSKEVQTSSTGGSKPPQVSFQMEETRLRIFLEERPFADYVFSDPVTTRPYFAHVKSPAGLQATRNHPPDPESDPTDHSSMHPGIWMSFGDINGHDYWRLKAKVRHESFIQLPEAEGLQGGFTVRNSYWSADDSTAVAQEETRYTVSILAQGYQLLINSRFSPMGDTPKIIFGDQEEFGLGVRVATPISEKGGGIITDSEGRRGAKTIWSKSGKWIDYSGEVAGQWVGMTILTDPQNFRPSWFHARDYGLIVANPFGRKAMQAGPESEVVVNQGQHLQIRYGVLVHSAPQANDYDAAASYTNFLSLLN